MSSVADLSCARQPEWSYFIRWCFIPQHSADLTAIHYFRATFWDFFGSLEGNVVDLFATVLITLTNTPYSKPNKKVVFELISHPSSRPAICIFNVYLTLWKNY